MINVLHLSDIHFGAEATDRVAQTAVAQRKNTLSSLVDTLKSLSNRLVPDIIAVSGDIAWKGCRADYDEARQWITSVMEIWDLSVSELVLCPGNHDIDRLSTTGIKPPVNSSEADIWLSVDTLQRVSNFTRPFQEYVEFCSSLEIPPYNLGDHESFLVGTRDIKGLCFICLNSAWFCRGDEDRGKLWLGLPQLEMMASRSDILQSPDEIEYDKSKIAIAMVHHPNSWLNDADTQCEGDRKNAYRYLAERSHLIMSGHCHGATEPLSRQYNRAYLCNGGATYAASNYRNNFSIIQFDVVNRTASRLAYELDPRENKWLSKHDSTVYSLAAVAKLSASNKRRPATRAKRNGQTVVEARTVDEYMNNLQNNFDFTWEPGTFLSSKPATVYWPVRLRPPTPIHAVQAFAAAGLQKLGTRVVLWVDDLGTNYPVIQLSSRVRELFSKVGGNANELEIRMFSDVLLNKPREDAWTVVQTWLGKDVHNLADVLSITKLWPEGDTMSQLRQAFEDRNPRRLLNPACVWTCLLIQQLADASAGVITLGGHDERPLWQAWRNSTDENVGGVGHLYIPTLRQDTRTVHMEKTNLNWAGKTDIREALTRHISNNPSPGALSAPDALIPWCLGGCVFLPGQISGHPTSLEVSGTVISDKSQLQLVEATALITALTEAISTWLF
jgi:calcineurin-like phosphoesterase family protein